MPPRTPSFPSARKVVVAIDSHESMQGRALFCLSALNFCVDFAFYVTFRLINLNSDNIFIAASALHWEHGLDIDADYCEIDGDIALSGVDLYAGAAFRTPQHMFLEAASRRGVPVFAAVQFPLAAWLSPSALLHAEAAFDPRIFAAHLGREVARCR